MYPVEGLSEQLEARLLSLILQSVNNGGYCYFVVGARVLFF